MLDKIDLLISFIQTGTIYETIWNIGLWVWYITGIVFIILFGLARLAEDGVASLKDGETDARKTIVSFLLVIVAIGLLYPFFYFVLTIKDGVIGFFDVGGAESILDRIEEKFLSEVTENEKGWLVSKVITGFVKETIYEGIYITTSFIELCVELGVKIGKAVVWGVVILLAPLCIASSLSNNLSLLKGWGLLLGGVIMWEFVSRLLDYFLLLSFLGIDLSKVKLEPADIYLMMSLFQVLGTVGAIASFWFAFLMVANRPAGIGLATPYVAGGLSIGTFLPKVLGRRATAMAGSGIQKAATKGGSEVLRTVLPKK